MFFFLGSSGFLFIFLLKLDSVAVGSKAWLTEHEDAEKFDLSTISIPTYYVSWLKFDAVDDTHVIIFCYK